MPITDPSDVAGLVGAWDFSDTASITESGGAVSQVDGAYGTSLALTQSTGSKKPTTGTRTQNGLNVLDFDGGDELTCAPGLGGDWTILAVALADTGIGGYACIASGNGSWEWGFKSNGHIHMYPNIDGASGPTFTLDAAHICEITLDQGVQVAVNVDGGTDVTAGVGTQLIDTVLRVGGHGSDDFLNGAIGEVLVYDSVLGASDREAVRNYLNAKWSVYASPTPSSDEPVSSSESSSVAATVSSSETAAGAEAASVATAISSSDSASGSESASLSVASSDPDSGSQSDAASISAASSGSDSGSGSEAESVSAAASGADDGSTSESQSSALSDDEAPTSLDSGSLAVTLSASDTAGSSESSSIDVGAVDVADGDTGSCSESGSIEVVLASADDGAGLDAASVSAAVAGADAATGVEVGLVDATLGGAETGSASDLADQVLLSADDSAAAADDGALAASLADPDTGSVLESAGVAAAVLGTGDLGSGVDSEALSLTRSSSDAATGSESSSIAYNYPGGRVLSSVAAGTARGASARRVTRGGSVVGGGLVSGGVAPSGSRSGVDPLGTVSAEVE